MTMANCDRGNWNAYFPNCEECGRFNDDCDGGEEAQERLDKQMEAY